MIFYILIDCYLGQKEKMAAIENTVEIEIEMEIEIEIEIEMYKKSLSMFVHQLVALIIFIRDNRIEHQSKF